MLFPLAAVVGAGAVAVQTEYTISLRTPVRVGWQSPLVIAPRTSQEETREAQNDQPGRRSTAFQQYARNKLPVCRGKLGCATG